MKRHTIALIGGTDGETATFTETDVDGSCNLECEYRGLRIQAKSSDFFEALCQIRTKLEKFKLIPFCYGASLDVYPSGMSRDMGRGLVAYRLRMGQPGRREDLVRIFDTGPNIVPVFVQAQKDQFDEWRESLRA